MPWDDCGMGAPEWLAEIPLPIRHVVVGATVLGAAGAVGGLIIGLNVYAPTAWAAVFEVGVPATTAGSLLGLISGVLAVAVHKIRRIGASRSAA
jgi:hypothetical protein